VKRLATIGAAAALVAAALLGASAAGMARSARFIGTPYVTSFDGAQAPLRRQLATGDGMAYAALAQDPTLARPDVFRAGREDAAYRASRPLWGYLAWAVSLGHAAAVPGAMALLAIAGAGLAAFALAQYLADRGRRPWPAIGVLVLPGAYASTVGLTPELFALALGVFALRAHQRDRRVLAIGLCAAAVLFRETMVVLPLALFLDDARRRRPRSIATLAAPFAALGAWYGAVWARLGIFPTSGHRGALDPVPMHGLVTAMRHWHDATTIVAALGCAVALVACRVTRDATARTIVLVSALLVPFMGSVVWRRWQDFGRPLLPLYAFGLVALLEAWERRTQRHEAIGARGVAAEPLVAAH
jgi:hypothetical protein